MGLDIVELILTIEEEFDIELPDAEMERAQTPRDIADYIYQKYQAYDKNKTHQSILNKVIEISIEQLNLSPDKITPDSRYVQDLGAC